MIHIEHSQTRAFQRGVAKCRSAQVHQLALLTDAKCGMVAADHQPFLVGAHLLGLSDKRSFSTAILPMFT